MRAMIQAEKQPAVVAAKQRVDSCRAQMETLDLALAGTKMDRTLLLAPDVRKGIRRGENIQMGLLYAGTSVAIIAAKAGLVAAFPALSVINKSFWPFAVSLPVYALSWTLLSRRRERRTDQKMRGVLTEQRQQMEKSAQMFQTRWKLEMADAAAMLCVQGSSAPAVVEAKANLDKVRRQVELEGRTLTASPRQRRWLERKMFLEMRAAQQKPTMMRFAAAYGAYVAGYSLLTATVPALRSLSSLPLSLACHVAASALIWHGVDRTRHKKVDEQIVAQVRARQDQHMQEVSQLETVFDQVLQSARQNSTQSDPAAPQITRDGNQLQVAGVRVPCNSTVERSEAAAR